MESRGLRIEAKDTVSWKARPNRKYSYRTRGIVDYVQDEVAYVYTESNFKFKSDKGRRIPKKITDLTLEKKYVSE